MYLGRRGSISDTALRWKEYLKKGMPMLHDSSASVDSDVNVNIVKAPKRTTLDFIRQFARTYACVQGTALGAIILN